MPSISSAWVRGSTLGLLPAARSSTASTSGMSPCGDRVAGRPSTLRVCPSSPVRPPKHSTADRTPSLSFINVSALTVAEPPRAVARMETSMPPSDGRRATGALPSVNRTIPSLPLNNDEAAQRFQPATSSALKSTACG
eukprot:130670-Pleurochrysis_carterae.AAC.1